MNPVALWTLCSLRNVVVISNRFIFKLIMQNINLCIRCEGVLGRMPPDLISERSILVQVMAWCCQATCRYPCKCSLRATARSYRRQDGADAAARFEKFLPARASLRPPISLKFTTEKHGGMVHLAPKRQTFSFLYNNRRKIRRETTVGKFVPK